MKKRFWLVSLILLLFSCAFLFNYFYRIEESRKINEILGHQKIHAKQAARNFNVLFDKWNSFLYYLSNDNNVILLNDNGKYELEKIYGVLKGEIKAITRTDKTGTIIFTTPYKSRIGTNIAKQKHMVQILRDFKPVVSDVFDAVQGFKAIVIHYPVYKDGQFDGTVAILLNFEEIASQILDDIKIGKSGHAWMLSSEGIQLYDPQKERVGKSILGSLPNNPEFESMIRKMLKSAEGVATYRLQGKASESETTYYMPVSMGNTYWALAISYSQNEITESLVSFRNRLIGIIIFIFLIGIYFAYFGLKAQVKLKESYLRKEIELTLEKERSLLRLLIDNLPSGVFIKDKEYRKILVNPLHAESIYGHLKSCGIDVHTDLIGKTDFEIFPEELANRFYHIDRKIIENGETILNNVESGYSPDGSVIWLLVSKVPIRDSDGSIIGMLGITTDITERKKIEEELILAKEKAEESDKLKTAFLNNISHEIRTPLNAIIGFSGLLKEENLSTQEQKHFSDIIIKSSEQLLMIITDIINIATIEAGQVKVHNTEVDLNAELLLLFEQYKERAFSKKIILNYSMSLGKNEALVITDQAKFIEIFSNLIGNAIKFTEKGSVAFGYEVEGNKLKFFVSDTGIGIKPEYQQIIFERFQQIKNKFTEKNRGTGLGLSITKAYVEALGGEIWLTSEPGKGSTFYFTLPYKKA